MPAKRKKKPATEPAGPLSVDEFNRFGWRLAIGNHMQGKPMSLGLTIEERIYHELKQYRSLKRVVVTMDEHHSSMGTSPIAIYKDEAGVEHHIGTSFPMHDLGFKVVRGRRFVVMVGELAPNPKMKPRKNPFQEKSRGRRHRA
jgi:hypothetical protein